MANAPRRLLDPGSWTLRPPPVLTPLPGGHVFAGTWEDLRFYTMAKCAACGELVKDGDELLGRHDARPCGHEECGPATCDVEERLCEGWPEGAGPVLARVVAGLVREAPDDQPNGPTEAAIVALHEVHVSMLDVVLPLVGDDPAAHGALKAAGDAIERLGDASADDARALRLAAAADERAAHPLRVVMWNDPTHPADPLRDLRDAQRANPDPFTAIMVAKLEAGVVAAAGSGTAQPAAGEPVYPASPAAPTLQDAPPAWIPLLPRANAGRAWGNLTNEERQEVRALYPGWSEFMLDAARWEHR